MFEREIHTPTDEEEEEIQRQIEQAPDAPEWTEMTGRVRGPRWESIPRWQNGHDERAEGAGQRA